MTALSEHTVGPCIDGCLCVVETAHSIEIAQQLFEEDKSINVLWCEVFCENGLDKFLAAGYTVPINQDGMVVGPLGNCTVILTRNMYNRMKGKVK